MLKPWILPGVAALALGAALALPQAASAHWAGAAAANQANAAALSDVIQVQRGWRGGGWRGAAWRGGGWRGAAWRGGGWRGAAWRGGWHGRWHGAHWRGPGWGWWGAPLAAAAITAPFWWGGAYAYAGPPCGWVWSPRRVRYVWRCW